jgi:UPF0176 protein
LARWRAGSPSGGKTACGIAETVVFGQELVMIYDVAAFYRFIALGDLPRLRERLLAAFVPLGLCGSLLIATEGINGTLAGSTQAIARMLDILAAEMGLSRDDVKFSQATDKPFDRLKVRLKREIITFNKPEADPTQHVGSYVEARDWNDLIADPDVTVIDTRNRYETLIGSFDGAVDPVLGTFTDFADFVQDNLDPVRHKKIAMYCTGGIRCEKASSYMLAHGFEEVYHLKGGILKYLEEVPAAESKWHGDCYVFDRRTSVSHGLAEGGHVMCFACGFPLNDSDRADARYEEGVACPHCHDKTGADDKARYRMRQAQINERDSRQEKRTAP